MFLYFVFIYLFIIIIYLFLFFCMNYIQDPLLVRTIFVNDLFD